MARSNDSLRVQASVEARAKLAAFEVAEVTYAIDIMQIKEVVSAVPYSVQPVPAAPALIEGVISLRGAVIPVIDLRRRFGVQDAPAPKPKLVIVEVEGQLAALRVDRVVGELRVLPSTLTDAPAMLRHEPSVAFFEQVCRLDDTVVFVVSLAAVVNPRIPNRAPARAGLGGAA